MSDFIGSEFFQILTQVLKVNLQLPFTVYIHLPLANRIIPFIGKDEVFTQAKLDKLGRFGHKLVFVHNDEKNVYFTWLDQFLKTEGGAELKQELTSTKNWGDLKGVPSPDEFQLTSLEGFQPTFEATPVSVVSEPTSPNGELTQEPVPEPVEESITLESPPIEEVLAAMPEPAVEDTQYSELLKSLRERVLELEAQVRLREELDKNDHGRTVIHDTTLKIEESVQVLDGNLPEEAFRKTIQDVTLKINDQVEIISSIEGISEKAKEALQRAVTPLKNASEMIMVTGNAGMPQEELKQMAVEVQKTIKKATSNLRIISGSREMGVFEEAVTGIIDSVQSTFNSNLQIQYTSLSEREKDRLLQKVLRALRAMTPLLQADPPDIAKIREKFAMIVELLENAAIADNPDPLLDELPPGYKVTFADPDVGLSAPAGIAANGPITSAEQIPRGSGFADPQLIEELNEVISSQNKVIDDLTTKLKAIRPEYTAILEKWATFQALTKRKLDASDSMKAKTISQSMQEFDYRFFNQINEERKNLRKNTKKLFAIIGKDDGAPEEVEEFEPQPGQSAQGGTEASSQEAEGTSNASEIERVRSENEILRVQLENAQALVETTIKKNADLEKLVNEGGTYAETLEHENEKQKKQIDELLSERDDAEKNKRRLTEGLEAANTTGYKSTVEIQTLTQQLKTVTERNEALENDLKTLRDKASDGKPLPPEDQMTPEAKRVLLLKNEELQKIADRMEDKVKEVKDLKKQIITLQGEANNYETEKKDLAKRMEKLRIEYETVRQHQKSLDIKVNMNNNLLSQARKSIGKLTTENEELRRDRVVYMRKTNDALAGHKSLVSQTVALNSQLAAEGQKSRQLQDQLDNIKRREHDTAKSLQGLQKTIENLEKENRKLKSEAQTAVGSNNAVNTALLEKNLKDMEKKFDNLREENKQLTAKLAQEQAKTRELQKTVRSLEARTKGKAS